MDTRDFALAFGPGDKLPYDIKAFHTVGLVASIEYESTGDHEYTGLFEGAPYGVARLGSLHGHYEVEATGGMFVGAAFKFFKDGMVSENLLTSPSHAQTNGNFFEQNLSNLSNPAYFSNTTAIPDEPYSRRLITDKKLGEFAIPLGESRITLLY